MLYIKLLTYIMVHLSGFYQIYQYVYLLNIWSHFSFDSTEEPIWGYHAETEDLKDVKRLQQDLKITNLKKYTNEKTVHLDKRTRIFVKRYCVLCRKLIIQSASLSITLLTGFAIYMINKYVSLYWNMDGDQKNATKGMEEFFFKPWSVVEGIIT